MASLSCTTYKNLVDDYISTSDSDSWKSEFVQNPKLGPYINRNSIIISTTSEDLGSHISKVPEFKVDELDEMLAEPLLTIPDDSPESLDSVTELHEEWIPVCISTYGRKYITFCFTDCILCRDNDLNGLYIPSRLFRKVESEMKLKGIKCSIANIRKKDVYVRVNIPQQLKWVASQALTNSIMNRVPRILEPVYKDGFVEYCRIKATVRIMLTPDTTQKAIYTADDYTIMQSKRKISIILLYLDQI